jgi:dTDP-4-dehydrorhamnose 3,5-epimerase-like enzyme/dTDP-4-dehydrorhamnose reductase
MDRKKNLKFEDNRGTLFFPIIDNTQNFQQCTISVNKQNVFRGIHSNPFDKLVTCIRGKILDIVINFDKNAENYLIPKYYTLDPETELFQILVPKNHGHAFLSLENDSTLVYHFNGVFADENTTHINYLDPILNIVLPIETPILSEKDKKPDFMEPIDFIVFGHKGFLGSNIAKTLSEKNKTFISSEVRLENVKEIEIILDRYKPKAVINCVGLTGVPNIFWCDDNPVETIETNVIYQLTLAKLCNDRNIHLTTIGSGGIFQNDKYYSESDEGNFESNFYSKCRIYLENMIKKYKNVLHLRVNYPISGIASSKNLLTKLLAYNKINDIEFSITYVDELFPKLIDMINNRETGVCNFVSDGAISPVKILEIYNKHKQKTFEIEKSNDNTRSNAKLHIGLLKKYGVAKVEDAVGKCVIEYIKNN